MLKQPKAKVTDAKLLKFTETCLTHMPLSVYYYKFTVSLQTYTYLEAQVLSYKNDFFFPEQKQIFIIRYNFFLMVDHIGIFSGLITLK